MTVSHSIIKGPVLVVAAHADDEVLGCGGTISLCAKEGMDVHVIFMTDGVSARADGNAGARQEAAKSACSNLGAHTPRFNQFPDNAMDTVPLIEVARVVEAVVQEIQPVTVFTHHYGDLNVDHEVVHRAVLTACRPQPGHCVKNLLTYSVRSSTEWSIASPDRAFRPSLFVNITTTLSSKIEALKAYSMELRPSPHSRSLEAVEGEARLVGSCCGIHAAEAFMVTRCIYD